MAQIEYDFTGWLCIDCFLTHHGYSQRELGHEFDERPLGLIEESTVLLDGMLYEEHECWYELADEDAAAYLAGHTSYRSTRETEDGVEVMPEECECETITFSSRTCDGCASALAGERHAVGFYHRVSQPVSLDKGK